MAGWRRIYLVFLLIYLCSVHNVNGKYSSSRSRHSSSSHGKPSRPSHSGSSSPRSYPSSIGLSGSSSGRRPTYRASTRKPYYPPSTRKPCYPSPTRKPYYPPSTNKPYYPPSSMKPYYPPSTKKPYYPPSSMKPYYPPSTNKPYYPPSSMKPYYPPSSSKPYYPPSTNKPYYPPSSSKPLYPASTVKPYYPPSTNKPYYPPSTKKPFYPASSVKPVYPPSTFKPKYPTTREPFYRTSTYKPNYNPTIIHHHHHHNHYAGYAYNPPHQVHYTPIYGGMPTTYPVYNQELPTYVYQYRSSGNKFNKLLAGLSLYNLGVSHSNHHMHNYYRHYTPENNELCTFGVKNPNYNQFSFDSFEYEEVKIDCRVISSIIWQHNHPTIAKNVTTVTSNTTTSTRIVQVPGTNQLLYPNGTLAQDNSLQNNRNSISSTQILNPDGTLMSRTLLVPIAPTKNTTYSNVTINNSSLPISYSNISGPLLVGGTSNATHNVSNNVIDKNQTLEANYTNLAISNNTYPTVSRNISVPTQSSSINATYHVGNASEFPDAINNTKLIDSKPISENAFNSSNVPASEISLVVNKTKDENNNISSSDVLKSETYVKPQLESLSQIILPNGTLIEEIKTTVTQTSTVLVTNLSDSRLSGSPINLTGKVECYVTRTTPTSKMRKTVDCGLLQTYSDNSLAPTSSKLISPSNSKMLSPSSATLLGVISMLSVYL